MIIVDNLLYLQIIKIYLSLCQKIKKEAFNLICYEGLLLEYNIIIDIYIIYIIYNNNFNYLVSKAV